MAGDLREASHPFPLPNNEKIYRGQDSPADTGIGLWGKLMCWIRVFAPLLVAAMMVWQPDFGHAQETDPARQLGNDNCAMLATAMVSGKFKAKEQEYLAGCARHPDASVCQNTKNFIETGLEHPLPELVCRGKSNAPSRADQGNPTSPGQPQRDGFKELDKLGSDPTDACSRYVVLKVGGYADTRAKEWLARCSRHPDPSVCQNAKNFMEESGQPAPELVCGKR
jgi:hypothetical protein